MQIIYRNQYGQQVSEKEARELQQLDDREWGVTVFLANLNGTNPGLRPAGRVTIEERREEHGSGTGLTAAYRYLGRRAAR
jgi:hypothetical protein